MSGKSVVLSPNQKEQGFKKTLQNKLEKVEILKNI